MNDVHRRLIEEKIKKLCNGCETLFDEDIPSTRTEIIDEQIDNLTGLVIKTKVEICYNCTYFRDANNSHFEEVAGECTFGCARPQTPNGYCKVFKNWRKG